MGLAVAQAQRALAGVNAGFYDGESEANPAAFARGAPTLAGKKEPSLGLVRRQASRVRDRRYTGVHGRFD